jgi:hypothetical protein
MSLPTLTPRDSRRAPRILSSAYWPTLWMPLGGDRTSRNIRYVLLDYPIVLAVTNQIGLVVLLSGLAGIFSAGIDLVFTHSQPQYLMRLLQRGQHSLNMFVERDTQLFRAA